MNVSPWFDFVAAGAIGSPTAGRNRFAARGGRCRTVILPSSRRTSHRGQPRAGGAFRSLRFFRKSGLLQRGVRGFQRSFSSPPPCFPTSTVCTVGKTGNSGLSPLPSGASHFPTYRVGNVGKRIAQLFGPPIRRCLRVPSDEAAEWIDSPLATRRLSSAARGSSSSTHGW